ncbi:acrosomal protein KIAA1210 homolog isoform X4 [Bubalus kerabau]|nr:acrosomal protein KIAA1210 homolog isoform X4 [Bubalus carabanensis]XP_055419979.1 acrosomal protein KIAA1210 homolog isoform X4 [Bubalus carabanensis]XP_055419980.1 acrosomal protein KIAA1210 homolog isoform X4 [Bubalus carabanensis]
MYESPSEISGSVEVLETSDEGKKKSRFKAFKSFFGKKKKKEPKDVHRGRWLKTSLSSSSIDISFLKSVEGQQTMPGAKSRMVIRALSHDSIFMLEPDLERSERKLYPSPEIPRGRPLQRSYVSTTLPRAGTGSMHEVVFRTVPRGAARSEFHVAGSEILLLRPCQPSISSHLIRSDSISKDLEEMSVDYESPKKSSSYNILTSKESAFEPSSRLVRSQSLIAFAMPSLSSSTQVPVGFNTPATTQSCLDSTAAQYKMALNPWKQKKSIQVTVKPKQEEPSLPVASEEEKSATKPKEADQKKPKKDSAGASGQEQSNKTEIAKQKTMDPATNTDATESQSYPFPAAYMKRHGKKSSSTSGMSERGSKGRSFKQSTGVLGLSDGAGSPPADKNARDCHFWQLSLEKQVMEQPTTPQTESTTPQELPSGKDDPGRGIADADFETRKASVSQLKPEDMEEPVVGGLSPSHEDGTSGAKKPEARAALSHVARRPSTPQDALSVAVYNQMFMEPSQSQPEKEEASDFDVKSVQFKMKSAQETLKEKPPRSVLQAITARISRSVSALVEGAICAGRPPPRSLSWSFGKSKAAVIIVDSKSTSEEGGDSEQQLAPGHSSPPPKMHRNEEVFPESKGSAVELSSLQQQQAPRYSSQSSGKSKATASFSDSKSTSKEGHDFEQHQAPTPSLQPLSKSKDGQEVFTKLGSLGQMSGSNEPPTPTCASQAVGEPEDNVSTGSNRYVEKYNSASDTKEEGSPRPPAQAMGSSAQAVAKPKDPKEVSLASKTIPEVQGASEWQVPPRDTFQSWVSPKFEQHASTSPQSVAMEWGISMEPLPPRVTSKRLRRPKVKPPVSLDPGVITLKTMTSAGVLPPRHPSQPSVKPAAQQEGSAHPESPDVEKTTPAHLLTFPHPSQPAGRPAVEYQDSMGAESAVVEKSISTKPLLAKHHSQPPKRALAQRQVSVTYSEAEQSVFAGLEGSVAQKISLAEKLLPKYSPQSLTNPRAQKTLESTAVKEGSFVEAPPPQPSVKSKFQPQTIPLESMSAPTEWSGLEVPVPPRPTIQQSWEIPMFEQPASEGPESAAFEWSITIEPLPPRGTSQASMRAGVKQAISEGPESVDTEGDASTELLLPDKHPYSIVKQKVQQISSSFESAAAKVGISGRPLPSVYPSRVLKKSKVLEMSLRLESMADKEVIPKKSVIVKHPSQSFVKYMVQHVFSERPATEEGTHMDPSSSNPPSKSLKPKVEQQVSSGWESTNVEGAISFLPSSGKPKGLQEVLSHSESAPVKLSSFKEQLPPRHLAQTLGKPEYQQETSSASESSPEEWKSSEEWLPGKRPSQVKDGAEFQLLMLSTGPVSAPVKRSRSERHLPPKQIFQAPADPEYQQQVYPSPVSAATEGTILESDPSCWFLPRDLASPSKIKKPSQSSEDLAKNVTTAPTKPMLATAPFLQAPTSGSSSSQEEVPESDDQNSSYSDSSNNGADVEKLFGVQLRRTSSSQKYKGKKQGFTKLFSPSLGSISSSVGTAQPIRRASKGALGTMQNLTTVSHLAEKQQRRPKSESMAKKQPGYRISGKAPGRRSEYAASEAAWITAIKQEQGSFQANIPPKKPRPKSRAAAKAEMKEPRYGVGPRAASKTLQKRTGLVSESQPRMVPTSDVKRQEKTAPTKPPKSTKTVGFEDEKIVQVPSMEKETRSATLPAMLPQPVEPAEPVWFSLAKKKAEAWSRIAETMQ